MSLVEETAQLRHLQPTLPNLLPRLILAALAANLTLEFARGLIDANNAIAAGVGQVGLLGYDQVSPTQEGIALIFTALAYGIVAILLVLQMLIRLALIDMLIVLAPGPGAHFGHKTRLRAHRAAARTIRRTCERLNSSRPCLL